VKERKKERKKEMFPGKKKKQGHQKMVSPVQVTERWVLKVELSPAN